MYRDYDHDAIVAWDPDGSTRHAPTDQQRAAFQLYIVATYGPGAWERYNDNGQMA